jgi:RNA polymerase sigma-70 factor (ECF subfamily)
VNPNHATDEIERVARESYARLIAFLSARSHDVAAAEDALADAVEAALAHWPQHGVPDRPEAWLLTAARHRLIDAARHRQVHAEFEAEFLALADEAEQQLHDEAAFPDERLKLMFVCAHAAIDRAARAPLMLQTVLGLDAARIAAAFLVEPAAMGQRLTRAKAKIREARLPFEVPAQSDFAPRLDAVLDAIYVAYGSGWDDVEGIDATRRGLAQEALQVCELLLRMLPDEPEALGLMALMLHCEARRDARRDAGRYVPLSEQDVSRWSPAHMRAAEECLLRASRAGRIGRFQLEAAIQSVHARRAQTGVTDWEEIALLYQGLVHLAPTLGALLGRAAAVAYAHGAEAGWQLLQQIPSDRVGAHQPYWALQAHLLRQLAQEAL